MKFPTSTEVDTLLAEPTLPSFVRVRYEPEVEQVSDPGAEAKAQIDRLPLNELEPGASIAVGVGSRGVHDIVPVAEAVVEELQERGYEPTVIPAMGSHGGATAEGQLEVLEALGVTEEGLSCQIDARMDVERIGKVTVGDSVVDVNFSVPALEADAVLPINRVKAHTNFLGNFESGICKMLVVGFGKQPGANAMHGAANAEGYEETIGTMLELILEEVPVLGGIAIVENFYDKTANITPVIADDLPEAEYDLLEESYSRMAMLPADDIDILIVDEIGKDISGTGMDTNVIGRYRVLNTDDPENPDVKLIYVRNLSKATKQNGNGIGLADLTRAAVIDEIDMQKVYANTLTSGSLEKGKLPIVLPNDKHVFMTAATAIGSYSPDRVTIAWIKNTGELSELVVSEALYDTIEDDVEPIRRERIDFDADGEMRFEPDVVQ